VRPAVLRFVDKKDVKDKDRAAGSSDASPHAKTFALDRKRIFVGSFNFKQGAGLMKRLWIGFLAILPIERLL
jgi:hypothetical protein